jgi:F-type H+-transporting ATPase subunit delta
MAELTEGIEARVVSATALGESRIFALENVLTKKLGKHVTLSASVDPSLIGGLYIHAGGQIIDHTIKKQLSDLKDNLKRRDAR